MNSYQCIIHSPAIAIKHRAMLLYATVYALRSSSVKSTTSQIAHAIVLKRKIFFDRLYQ